mmetsp:Transcript_34623/g.98552  ORF Transcript_34623/g.98552 Transcript_34623/m.98552 type:complete len:197 (+) Transcript_34623:40-630(+)
MYSAGGSVTSAMPTQSVAAYQGAYTSTPALVPNYMAATPTTATMPPYSMPTGYQLSASPLQSQQYVATATADLAMERQQLMQQYNTAASAQLAAQQAQASAVQQQAAYAQAYSAYTSKVNGVTSGQPLPSSVSFTSPPGGGFPGGSFGASAYPGVYPAGCMGGGAYGWAPMSGAQYPYYQQQPPLSKGDRKKPACC